MPKRALQPPPYSRSLAGVLLAAREAVMMPIRPILRDAGVTDQQWRVLRVLDASESIDTTSLAHAALLYAPSVTRILKDMVERGLVLRETDAMDGRRSILSLSGSGRALVRKTSKKTIRNLNDYYDLFGEERLDALIAELRALIEMIETTYGDMSVS